MDDYPSLPSEGNGILNILPGATLTNANTSSDGGAVGIIGNLTGTDKLFVNMTGGTISNCTGGQGGAFYISSGAVVNLSGGIITNCTSASVGYQHPGLGGAAYLNDPESKLNISGNMLITGNAAYDGGGAIYSKGAVTMTGGVIAGNRVINGDGGIIPRSNSGVYFSGGNGGGVYIDNTNNTDGGAVSSFSMKGGTIRGNRCPGYGGGVYVASGTSTKFEKTSYPSSLGQGILGKGGSGNLARADGYGHAVANGTPTGEWWNWDRHLGPVAYVDSATGPWQDNTAGPDALL
jgi:predicted outer membrane repeat protein